ncbi:serine/threonine protein kinase, partial [Streptomyces venezuelae]
EDTLYSRHEHAIWTGEAGDPARARDLFGVLVADRVRVLGPDHNDTLDSRYKHARWADEADGTA